MKPGLTSFQAHTVRQKLFNLMFEFTLLKKHRTLLSCLMKSLRLLQIVSCVIKLVSSNVSDQGEQMNRCIYLILLLLLTTIYIAPYVLEVLQGHWNGLLPKGQLFKELCKKRQLPSSITKHYDLLALKEMLYSLAQSSQMACIIRCAEADRARSVLSSAYANAPTKLSPIKRPTLAFDNATNKPSIYKQKRTGLKTPTYLKVNHTLKHLC